MQAPFDLLKKDRGGVLIWLEAANDLTAASARLRELAARVPGDYFLFDQRTQQTVEEVSSKVMTNSH